MYNVFKPYILYVKQTRKTIKKVNKLQIKNVPKCQKAKIQNGVGGGRGATKCT